MTACPADITGQNKAKAPDGLFDDANTWETNPVGAFEGLLASAEFVALGRRDLTSRKRGDTARATQAASGDTAGAVAPVSAKSAQVYLAMFRSYVNHLATIDVLVPQAQAEHIVGFIEAKDRTTGVRHRYIRMLERVHEHMLRRGIVRSNAASIAAPILLAAPKQARRRELPTAVVNAPERAGLAESVVRSMLQHDDWRSVRDATMAAILLGAGLKVYELVAMRTTWLTGIHPNYVVEIPAIGVSRPHRVPLTPLAADCVRTWLNCRLQHDFRQPLMFVNSLTEGRLPYVPLVSKVTGAPKTSAGLDASTVYRRMKAIMKAAGIEAPRMGGRTLRNTYAVTELAGGQPAELVEERLGLREKKSLGRYVAAAKRETKGRQGDLT